MVNSSHFPFLALNRNSQTRRQRAPQGDWIHVRKDFNSTKTSRLFSLPPSCRWMALRRTNLYWMQPAFGSALDTIPPETQFLLFQQKKTYTLFLPLIEGDLRATLKGNGPHVEIAFDGALPDSVPKSMRALYMASGREPFTLIRDSMSTLSREMKSFRLREEKPAPEFQDYFGWCTWNAFYDKVDERKMDAGLQSWKKGRFIPSLVLLDDGWLDRKVDLLNDFPADKKKFPRGLASPARMLKEKYGVKRFGIWHAFQGYWAGLNPDGALAKRYRTTPNQGKMRPWEKENEKVMELNLVHPDEIYRFYHEFYRYLKSQGVEMVKVDGQSSLEVFCRNVLGRVSAMRAYQEAFQSAGASAFGSNLLHCMSHSSDVIYHSNLSNCIRNSDDYFPQKENSAQQLHLQINAYNALWISQVAVPDWDMFQSHHPHSSYHAAARAISGGPIYVSDKPGKQNFRLLEKLVWFENGDTRTLQCPNPALVTRDRLMTDCTQEPKLLKIFNQVHGIGLLGFFHTNKSGDRIQDSFKPTDVENLKGALFAVWRHRAETLEILTRRQASKQILKNTEWELAIISPIHHQTAILGLLDKYNSPAGIEKVESSKSCLKFETKDGGRVGIYCRHKPLQLMLNGCKTTFNYHPKTGLLVISLPKRKSSTVVVILK